MTRTITTPSPTRPKARSLASAARGRRNRRDTDLEGSRRSGAQGSNAGGLATVQAGERVQLLARTLVVQSPTSLLNRHESDCSWSDNDGTRKQPGTNEDARYR